MIPDEIRDIQAVTGWTDKTVLHLTFEWLTARKRGGSISGLIRFLKGVNRAEQADARRTERALKAGLNLLLPSYEPAPESADRLMS